MSLRCYGIRMEPSGVCYRRDQCTHFVEWPHGGGKAQLDACTPTGHPFTHFQAQADQPGPTTTSTSTATRRHQQQELFK